MSHSNGIISAPVDLVGDVAAVLGVTTYDVAYLCSNNHGKINKWAKFKPERLVPGASSSPHQKPDILALEARKNNNFGLSPAEVYSGKSNFITAVANGSFKSGWDYYAPRPGSDCCRLTDFDGYYHKATSPFGTLQGNTFILSNSTTNSLLIPGQMPIGEGDAQSLSIKDFNGRYPVKDWYFGVLLFLNSSRYFIATRQRKFSESEDWQVDFGWINPSYAGTYKGVPFLANAPFTVSGAEPANLLIMGIGNPGVTITLKTTSSTYVPFANCMYPTPAGNVINYYVSINNTTSSSRTFAAVTLQCATNMSGANQTNLVNFGSVTVAANSRWEKTGSINVTQANYYQFCRLIYTGNTTTSWINFEVSPNETDG